MRSQIFSLLRGWRSWIVAAGGLGAVVAAVALSASLLQLRQLDTSIMHTEPDAVRLDARLKRRADEIAAPAFSRHCAACHNSRGEGDMQKGAPDLTDDDWLFGQGRPNEIEQTVLHGIRAGDPRGHAEAVMPAYGDPSTYNKLNSQPLSSFEVKALAAYVLRLSHMEAPAEDAVAGNKIFLGKGGCYDCHGRQGDGDAAIGVPKLNDSVWFTTFPSAAGIEDVVLNGRAGICPAWNRRLTPLQVRSLAVFVAGLSDPQTTP